MPPDLRRGPGTWQALLPLRCVPWTWVLLRLTDWGRPSGPVRSEANDSSSDRESRRPVTSFTRTRKGRSGNTVPNQPAMCALSEIHLTPRRPNASSSLRDADLRTNSAHIAGSVMGRSSTNHPWLRRRAPYVQITPMQRPSNAETKHNQSPASRLCYRAIRVLEVVLQDEDECGHPHGRPSRRSQ